MEKKSNFVNNTELVIFQGTEKSSVVLKEISSRLEDNLNYFKKTDDIGRRLLSDDVVDNSIIVDIENHTLGIRFGEFIKNDIKEIFNNMDNQDVIKNFKDYLNARYFLHKGDLIESSLGLDIIFDNMSK